MAYIVHRLEIRAATAQETLENFLNRLEGEIVAVLPLVTPALMILGGSARSDAVLVVERREALTPRVAQ